MGCSDGDTVMDLHIYQLWHHPIRTGTASGWQRAGESSRCTEYYVMRQERLVSCC